MRARRRKEEKKIKTARVEANAVSIHLKFSQFFVLWSLSVVFAFRHLFVNSSFLPKKFSIFISNLWGKMVRCTMHSMQAVTLIRFIFISYVFWKNNNETPRQYSAGVECHRFSLPDSSRQDNCTLRTHLIFQWRFYYNSTFNILMRFRVFQLLVACNSIWTKGNQNEFERP